MLLTSGIFRPPGCHFILGVKEDDHKYLFGCVGAAVEAGKAIEHDLPDPQNSDVRHRRTERRLGMC
jgi:hypothetical protein